MIWMPFPNVWPMCDRCNKPVERLTEIVAVKDAMSFRCYVECHGEQEQVEFSGDLVRRIHFNFGIKVFVPK